MVIAKRAAAHDGTVDPEVEENTEEIVEDTESTEMENSEESKDNNSSNGLAIGGVVMIAILCLVAGAGIGLVVDRKVLLKENHENL